MFFTGEIAACPHETSFHVRFDCAAIQPHALGVSFSGRAVIGGKRIITEFRGRRYHLRSREADCAVRDGKTKIRAGGLRPAVAVWLRGRQDAALNGKKLF
jgi:hypothetical protein